MSGKLLIAAFVALLVGGLVLWRFANTDSAAAGRSTANTPAPAVEDGSATPGPSSDGTQTAQGSATAQPLTEPRSVRSRPEIAEAITIPPSEEIEYRPDGVPIAVADLDVLRDAAPPTDDLVRECIAKHGGKAVSGTLITTYTVARKRQPNGTFTVETESTGTEEEGSNITDPGLVECMRDTANAMKFPPHKSPVATWARRRITVENGVLGENWVFQHGYIR